MRLRTGRRNQTGMNCGNRGTESPQNMGEGGRHAGLEGRGGLGPCPREPGRAAGTRALLTTEGASGCARVCARVCGVHKTSISLQSSHPGSGRHRAPSSSLRNGKRSLLSACDTPCRVQPAGELERVSSLRAGRPGPGVLQQRLFLPEPGGLSVLQTPTLSFPAAQSHHFLPESRARAARLTYLRLFDFLKTFCLLSGVRGALGAAPCDS